MKSFKYAVFAGMVMWARSLSADVIFTEPHGNLLPGQVVTGNTQDVGVTFSLNNAVEIQDIIVQMGNFDDVNTFFVALCELNPATQLPYGNPFQSGYVLSTQLFTAPSSSVTSFTIPFAVDAPAGEYGLVFGGNSFGANAPGGLSATYDAPPGGSMIVWNASSHGWFYDGYATLDVTIEGTIVPEPSPISLFCLAGLAFVLFRAKTGLPHRPC